MRITRNGAISLELVVVVIVLAVVGVLGYVVGSLKQDDVPIASNNTQPTMLSAIDIPIAPQVKTAQDLTSVLKAMNRVNLGAGASGGSQLDAQASAF